MRIAVMEIEPQALVDSLLILRDAGLAPICALPPAVFWFGLSADQLVPDSPMRLVMAGEELPPECERDFGQIRIVSATFHHEIYGAQSLTKVVEFKVDPKRIVKVGNSAMFIAAMI